MIWLDTETFGTLDLRKVGSYRYAAHEDTEVLLVPYALDDDDPQVIDVDGRKLWVAIKADAPELMAALDKGSDPIVMHNSNFDRHILNHQGVDIDPSYIEDTMAIAFTLGLPGKLVKLGEALGLPLDMQKMKRGNALIHRFCKPAPKNHKADRYDRYSHPDEWEEFKEYAMMDVVSMRECYKRMPKHNITSTERKLWLLDQRINDLGVKVDFDHVRKAIKLADSEQERINEEIQTLTWGEVDKHTKSAAILSYCKEEGLALPNLQKETVEATLLRGDLPDSVRRLLQLRLEANKATVSKYTAMGARASTDGRLRGGFQYGGAARTLRWAGRGVQLHNLARPPWWLDQEVAKAALLGGYVDQLYPNSLDVVKGIVRGAFVPKDGHTFVVSDLSNIEGRVSAWVAGEDWKLDAFRKFDRGEGPDIYIKTYSESFGVPIDKVTKDQRQVGKVQELAGGYQGWIGAWRTFEAAYGLPEADEDDVIEIMGNWRDAHPAIRSCWGNLEQAWRSALENPGSSYRVGKHVTFRYYKKRDLLAVWLPSGRFVPYLHPRADSSGLRFKGLNDKGLWTWIDTYGGKLLENIVQAISRDVLGEAMLVMDSTGHIIVLHVHDEVVEEAPADKAEAILEEVNKILATSPDWAPDLPLAAAGFIADAYRKE
jgi:DNA polymerase